MKLSAPIFRLKKTARLMSRDKNIPLHVALDAIAQQEGFSSWSLLSAKYQPSSQIDTLFAALVPGDLVLLAGRPYAGKTTIGLNLIARAHRSHRQSAFFSLDMTEPNIHDRLTALGVDQTGAYPVHIDASNEVCASYLISQLSDAQPGTVIVIDYLQILDLRRDKPALNDQIQQLKLFAKDRGAIVVLLSQVDRGFERKPQRVPVLSDVHLPNPLDLRLFTKTCFVGDGRIQLAEAA